MFWRREYGASTYGSVLICDIDMQYTQIYSSFRFTSQRILHEIPNLQQLLDFSNWVTLILN